jgi:hypothetical protein
VQPPGHDDLRDFRQLGEALLVSSCRAPKGQSQPQNGPRPQNSSAAATENHRDEDQRRSTRKYDQLKSVMTALAKVKTLTTESCACATQPSQTSVTAR